jgi:hypothetical protein
VWYRGAYGNLLKSDQDAFRDLFSGVLDGAPPKPLRGRIIHFYSWMYYDVRVKQRVEAHLEALKRRSDVSGEPMPRKIDVIAKVTSDVWEEETPAFPVRAKAEGMGGVADRQSDPDSRGNGSVSVHLRWHCRD